MTFFFHNKTLFGSRLRDEAFEQGIHTSLTQRMPFGLSYINYTAYINFLSKPPPIKVLIAGEFTINNFNRIGFFFLLKILS